MLQVDQWFNADKIEGYKYIKQVRKGRGDGNESRLTILNRLNNFSGDDSKEIVLFLSREIYV